MSLGAPRQYELPLYHAYALENTFRYRSVVFLVGFVAFALRFYPPHRRFLLFPETRHVAKLYRFHRGFIPFR